MPNFCEDYSYILAYVITIDFKNGITIFCIDFIMTAKIYEHKHYIRKIILNVRVNNFDALGRDVTPLSLPNLHHNKVK